MKTLIVCIFLLCRAHLKQTVSTLQEELERTKQEENNLRQQLLEAKQLDSRRQKEVEK